MQLRSTYLYLPLVAALLAVPAMVTAQVTTPALKTTPAPGAPPSRGAARAGNAAGRRAGKAGAGAATTAVAPPPPASEFATSHLAAALDAVISSQGTKAFDDILPKVSQQVQNKLIQIRPDLYKQIGDVVQAAALK